MQGVGFRALPLELGPGRRQGAARAEDRCLVNTEERHFAIEREPDFQLRSRVGRDHGTVWSCWQMGVRRTRAEPVSG